MQEDSDQSPASALGVSSRLAAERPHLYLCLAPFSSPLLDQTLDILNSYRTWQHLVDASRRRLTSPPVPIPILPADLGVACLAPSFATPPFTTPPPPSHNPGLVVPSTPATATASALVISNPSIAPVRLASPPLLRLLAVRPLAPCASVDPPSSAYRPLCQPHFPSNGARRIGLVSHSPLAFPRSRPAAPPPRRTYAPPHLHGHPSLLNPRRIAPQYQPNPRTHPDDNTPSFVPLSETAIRLESVSTNTNQRTKLP